ncbi:MAG: phosphatase PAP2 family protein [Candidatus Shapirobacteria bacterium]
MLAHLKKTFLFWQPRFDFLKWLESTKAGQYVMIFLNYIIWFFFIFISFILVHKNSNIFWSLLVITVIAELIERYIKTNFFWCRPMFIKKDEVPKGLVKSWYKTGSFPSGHTMKSAYFLLFLIQNQVFSPTVFLIIVVPLLFFRVLVGFHYPIDILGGILIGFILWFFIKDIVFPDFMVNSIKVIFDYIYSIF